ncbi:MAG: hypothetical protein AB9M60_11095, partial [Leptothrix sp. (in: b-proteobacteria)]
MPATPPSPTPRRTARADAALHPAAHLASATTRIEQRLRTQLPAWATLTLSIACAAVLVLIEGCATPGTLPTPAKLANAPALGLVEVPDGAALPELSSTWWTGWGDPALNQLIEQA